MSLAGPLLLKIPATSSLGGGPEAGEHRARGEGQGDFRIFSGTGLVEDGVLERWASRGFNAPVVATD